jgi:hypothetical protein
MLPHELLMAMLHLLVLIFENDLSEAHTGV